MVKNKTILEVEVNERKYEFECPPDSPLGELHDALCKMQLFILERMKDEQKRQTEIKEDKVAEAV